MKSNKKRSSILKFLFLLPLSLVIACNQKKSNNQNYQIKSEPIVQTVGNIDVVVDPTVEMLMVIGRLARQDPYVLDKADEAGYLETVDTYFKKYKLKKVVSKIRRWRLGYETLPELGMYLNNDLSGFVMNLNDSNFITTQNGPAGDLPFYNDQKFITSIRDFWLQSKFDEFFTANLSVYQNNIKQTVDYLNSINIDEWMNDFYGTKSNKKISLYITSLQVGGAFVIDYQTQEGESVPHLVIMDTTDKNLLLYLLSNKTVYPQIKTSSEKLYENETIKTIFDNLYAENAYTYHYYGYTFGKKVLEQTILQACANKFLEAKLPETVMNAITEQEILERQKLVYVPFVTDLLNDYVADRKAYRTIEDFLPELEEGLCDLAK